MTDSIRQAADQVRDRFGVTDFDLAIILGSGMTDAVSALGCSGSLAYDELTGVPAEPIPGHAGRLSVSSCDNRQILVFHGRFHCYQGLSAADAAWPVRLAAELGVTHLLATSAVGGIAAHLSPGDLVLIQDHINLLGDNPLRGLRPPPFIDLAGLYKAYPIEKLQMLADNVGISLSSGVLAAMPGPSYETPAEIEMLRRLGVDVVSMSMVPEALMARYYGMSMIGLALVTNLAAGMADDELSHSEVLAVGEKGGQQLSRLLPVLLPLWLSS